MSGEVDWLCAMLDAQGDPNLPTEASLKIMRARQVQAKYPENTTGTYITPPNMRKADAANALRVPVIAVKVGGEESWQPSPLSAVSAVADLNDSISAPSEPEWDTSTSCVPAGAAWVTTVPPPRREKRSRKAAGVPARKVPEAVSDGGYASSGEVAPLRRRSSNDSTVSSLSSHSRRPAAYASKHVEDDDFLRVDDIPPLLPVPTDRLMRAADDVHNLMAPEKFAELVISKNSYAAPGHNESEESNSLYDEFGAFGADEEALLNDPSLNDSSRRKVRHNLTERRRVDRMNQLFNKLYMAIEDTAPPMLVDMSTNEERLTVCGADGKPINPNKWSKADVLEGALNVIQDLRKQLVEERLARTLGMPISGEYAVDDGSM